jgi:actin
MGDVTEYLMKLLRQRGNEFKTSAEHRMVKDIKEKHCYIALDYESEYGKAKDVTYELPDGNIISFDKEAYMAPEIFFQPALIGMESPNLTDYIQKSIYSYEDDIMTQVLLFDKIVLSGGNSLYNGIKERLEKEVSQYVIDEIGCGKKKKF